LEDTLIKGWIPNHIPKPLDYDRHLVLVPQTHPFAAIFRCLGRVGVGPVPIGIVESRVQLPLHDVMTGIYLSRYGLAILKVVGNEVILRGTTTGMASVANLSRCGHGHGSQCEYLVKYATGLELRPRLIDDDVRLRTALAFDELLVDVPGILAGEDQSDFISRWRFPVTESSIADAPF